MERERGRRKMNRVNRDKCDMRGKLCEMKGKLCEMKGKLQLNDSQRCWLCVCE